MLNTAVPEISVQQLKAAFDCDHAFCLLDVRELEERSIAVLPENKNTEQIHIPLMELESRLEDCRRLSQNSALVVYCRSGARSAAAVAYLRESGLSEVKNLSGGILAWAKEIDPSVTTY